MLRSVQIFYPDFSYHTVICTLSKQYGQSFLDIDECSDATDDCHADAVCTNTVGSYTCACNGDYQGDGVNSGTGCTSNLLISSRLFT